MMGFLSIFTNIILFTFASDQIDHVLPFLKHYKNDSATSVLTIFGIEHFLIAFAILLRYIFDTEPKWVSLFF